MVAKLERKPSYLASTGNSRAMRCTVQPTVSLFVPHLVKTLAFSTEEANR
jgi:hypothetical protein